jgi:two-component system, LuxR family, sensor kinase FixL
MQVKITDIRGQLINAENPVPSEQECRLLSETITWDVLASIADAVVTIDEEHRVVYCNRVAETMFGYTIGELVGQDVSPLIPEPHHSMHRGYVDQYILTKEGRVIGKSRECVGRRRNGDVFPVEISYSVSRTAGRLYFTAVIRDISQRKRMEREMRFMEKLADVGKGVANVVHEIRKPLMLIGGFARQVASCPSTESMAKQKLQIIVDEVRRLETLLNGVRLLTRPPGSSEKQSLLVTDLLKETLEFLDPMLGDQNIVVHTEFSHKQLYVLGDPDQLKQVFLNLLQNAMDAMNGVGQIRIALRSNGLRAEIEIRDSGPGIPPEMVEKIFDPFFTTKPEGTGLGLAITKNIIQEHGGEIGVRSETGEGTCFLLRLPLERT